MSQDLRDSITLWVVGLAVFGLSWFALSHDFPSERWNNYLLAWMGLAGLVAVLLGLRRKALALVLRGLWILGCAWLTYHFDLLNKNPGLGGLIPAGLAIFSLLEGLWQRWTARANGELPSPPRSA